MEANQTTTRLHPLVAGVAASLILVSLLGVAAMTCFLPSSHGSVAGTQAPEATSAAQQPMASAAASMAPATAAPITASICRVFET